MDEGGSMARSPGTRPAGPLQDETCGHSCASGWARSCRRGQGLGPGSHRGDPSVPRPARGDRAPQQQGLPGSSGFAISGCVAPRGLRPLGLSAPVAPALGAPRATAGGPSLVLTASEPLRCPLTSFGSPAPPPENSMGEDRHLAGPAWEPRVIASSVGGRGRARACAFLLGVPRPGTK